MYESPQRLTKFICGFRKCHSVCSNVWEISFVTTLLRVMLLTRKGNVLGEYICELLVLFHRGEINKGLRRSISFPRLKFSKHEIVWKQHATFLNRAKDDSKRCAVIKAFLALKGRTDITWNINCYRPLRRECVIACMNLNSKTDCIMLTMLERMRLTCCVLPQEKHLKFPV